MTVSFTSRIPRIETADDAPRIESSVGRSPAFCSGKGFPVFLLVFVPTVELFERCIWTESQTLRETRGRVLLSLSVPSPGSAAGP